MTGPPESRHTVLGHAVIVRRLGERLFRATCPEFPKLSTTGRSLEQALSRAQEWLRRQRDLTPNRLPPEPVREIVAEAAHDGLPAPDQAGLTTIEPATPVSTKRDKLILNERAKLSATALNTIAMTTV